MWEVVIIGHSKGGIDAAAVLAMHEAQLARAYTRPLSGLTLAVFVTDITQSIPQEVLTMS